MIKTIKSEERHHANNGWLDTYWHFSFGPYYDPSNMNWGALRVFNDDVFGPGHGFGMHPHQDMEIITYVLAGEVEHEDSTGSRGVIHPGEVQVMSAGTGIMHSEFNHSKEKDLHFMQIWILPRKEGRKPRWEQHQFTPSERKGKLLPIVSGGDIAGTLAIDQDAQIYVSALPAGGEVKHQSQPDRKVYVFAIEGEVSVNGVKLAGGDQARVADEPELSIKAAKDSELILLDLPGLHDERLLE
ncbi:MAG: pirin family protein [Terriglobia bacterium]